METNQTNTPPQASAHAVPPHSTPEQQQKEQIEKGLRGEHRHFHDYKSSRFARFFWGLFVIIIGVMFLAQTLGFVSGISIGLFFSRLWPVFIIFAGLSIMSRGGFFAGIISSILMLAILALIVVWFFRIPVHGRVGSSEYRLAPDTMQNWMQNNYPGR